MSRTALHKIIQGLKEAQAYENGEREGYKVTVPPTVDVKSIRKQLKMTQAAFSDSFGFSLDAVKHWEGGRRTPEVPARAYLTVIQHNPAAVLEALRQKDACARSSPLDSSSRPERSVMEGPAFFRSSTEAGDKAVLRLRTACSAKAV